MKTFLKFIVLSFAGIFLFVLNSCSVSNDVVSNKLFQKRKYRSGWYVKKIDRKIESNESAKKEEYYFQQDRNTSHEQAIRIQPTIHRTEFPEQMAGLDKDYGLIIQANIENDAVKVSNSKTGSKVLSMMGNETIIKESLKSDPTVRNDKKPLEPMTKTSVILFWIMIGLVAVSIIFIPVNPYITAFGLIAAGLVLVALFVTSIIALTKLKDQNENYRYKKGLVWFFAIFSFLAFLFLRYLPMILR